MNTTGRYQILGLLLANIFVQLHGYKNNSSNLKLSYDQDIHYRVEEDHHQILEVQEVGSFPGLQTFNQVSYWETRPQMQEVKEYDKGTSRRTDQFQNQHDQDNDQIVQREPGQLKNKQKLDIREVQSDMESMEEPPYFDASMFHTHTAFLGKPASLTCIVHDAQTDNSVSWIRDRDLRILTVGRYTYTTDLRFEALHHPGSSEWTMRIKSVQTRDEGIYVCQIATKPIRTFNVSLKVVEPTVEVLGAPDIYINMGSMINLTCIIYNAPTPPKHIIWSHYNEGISYTSPRGGITVIEERGETTSSCLLLQKARVLDNGLYTCHPHGMTPVELTVHVQNDATHSAELYAAMSTQNKSQMSCKCSALHIIVVLVFISIMGL